MAESRDGTGAVLSQYFDKGEKSGTTSYYFTEDHLGSVRDVSNSLGVVQAEYRYDPYGRIENLSTSSIGDHRYACYYLHQRSGLDMTLHRFYNPSTGTWLSRDPVNDNMLPNLYKYCSGNPIGAIDPSGLAADLPKLPISAKWPPDFWPPHVPYPFDPSEKDPHRKWYDCRLECEAKRDKAYEMVDAFEGLTEEDRRILHKEIWLDYNECIDECGPEPKMPEKPLGPPPMSGAVAPPGGCRRPDADPDPRPKIPPKDKNKDKPQ